MRHYEAIFKPLTGVYRKAGGQEYSGTNQLKRETLSEADVLHFFSMGALIWSDHPEVMHALACGAWKQRRREASQRGIALDESKPNLDDFMSGLVSVPPPNVLPSNVARAREDGMEYLGVQDNQKLNAQMMAQESAKRPLVQQQEWRPQVQQQAAVPQQPVAQELDSSKVSALRERFMRFAYKSLDTFAERVGEDPAYIRQVGKDWLAEKARAKD